MKRCPICDHSIDEYDDTTECESCQVTMHIDCSCSIRDPLDEHFVILAPECKPENPRDFCLTCYDARADMVRSIMVGEVVRGFNNTEETRLDAYRRWNAKYGPILDAWPDVPEQAAVAR